MTEATRAASPRLWARTAGVLYLITIIMGVFAEVFVRGALAVRNDAAATAMNILANENFYRSGLVADLIMLASYLAVTLLFYVLFRPVSRLLSLLAAFFSLMGIAVLAVNCLTHMAPLILLRGERFMSGFDMQQLRALALLSLKMHSLGYTISSVFFGIYCILVGTLAYRSGFLPRLVGVLMAIGGLSFLASSFVILLFPPLAARLPDIGMLGGIGELALCLWLIGMGVDATKWKRRQLDSIAV